VNTGYCTWCHNLLDQKDEWLNNRLLGAEFGSRPGKQAEMRWRWGMKPVPYVSVHVPEDRRRMRLAEAQERETRVVTEGDIFVTGIQRAKRMVKKARGHESSRARMSGQGLPIFAGWADRYDRDPVFRAECRNAKPPKTRIIWFRLNVPGDNKKSGMVRPIEMKWLMMSETMGVESCCVEERAGRTFPDRSLTDNEIVEQHIKWCPLECQPKLGEEPSELDQPAPEGLNSDEEDYGDDDAH
jgi:hypothetical protein